MRSSVGRDVSRNQGACYLVIADLRRLLAWRTRTVGASGERLRRACGGFRFRPAEGTSLRYGRSLALLPLVCDAVIADLRQ